MRGSTFTANWEVEDGYVGKSRPQHAEIDLDEFEEDMNDEDIEGMIWDMVQRDFDQKITYYVSNISEVVSAVKEYLRNRGNE